MRNEDDVEGEYQEGDALLGKIFYQSMLIDGFNDSKEEFIEYNNGLRDRKYIKQEVTADYDFCGFRLGDLAPHWFKGEDE